MDNATQEGDRALLRAQLLSFGPAAMLERVGALCAELAAVMTEPERIEMLARASHAASVAASFVRREDIPPSTRDDEEDDDELTDEDDDEEDDDELTDDEPDARASNELTTDDKATRAEEHHGAGTTEGAPAPPTVSPKHEDAMGLDRRFAPKREDMTVFRVRRVDSKGERELMFAPDTDGLRMTEWPLRDLNVETVRARWGGGNYVFEYYGFTENGDRISGGRSPIFTIVGDPLPSEPRKPEDSPMPRPPMPSAPEARGSSPMMMGGMGGQMDPFMMLAYIEERAEKTRAAAFAEAQAANARYRADVDLLIAREQNASQERIAQMEALYKNSAKAHASSSLDPELLAERIGSVVGAKMQAVLEQHNDDEDDDDDDEPAVVAPASPDPVANSVAIVNAVRDAMAPILSMITMQLNANAEAAKSGKASE